MGLPGVAQQQGSVECPNANGTCVPFCHDKSDVILHEVSWPVQIGHVTSHGTVLYRALCGLKCVRESRLSPIPPLVERAHIAGCHICSLSYAEPGPGCPRLSCAVLCTSSVGTLVQAQHTAYCILTCGNCGVKPRPARSIKLNMGTAKLADPSSP